MSDTLLTTIDNPYSPFTNWIRWVDYDEEAGYHTCEYLARICPISNSLTDEENYTNINLAIDEIILYDFRNIYRKVRAEDYSSNGIIKEEVLKKFHSYSTDSFSNSNENE